MFARGNWAVFGFDPTSLPAFEAALGSPVTLFRKSQLANAAITALRQLSTFGINPFAAPRMDEKFFEEEEDAQEKIEWLAALAAREDLAPEELASITAFGDSLADFQITPTLYGFWFVSNKWKDITHVASRKEGLAIDRRERPYKFLDKDSKKEIDAAAVVATDVERKQFPVLLDVATGRVYAEVTSKGDIENLQFALEQMGLALFSLCWSFGNDGDWPSKFLSTVVEETRYRSEFNKRAEDSKVFGEQEAETIEDPEVRKIVASFFATAELPTGQWASLKAPAAIRLFKASGPVSVSRPPDATLLLASTDEAHPVSASVLFQERITYTRKGVEGVFRKDLYSLDINENMNLADVGAAILRGFDVSGFVKGVTKEIRKTKQVPSVAELWRRWRDGMNEALVEITANIHQTLDLDGSARSGIVPMSIGAVAGYGDSDDSDELLRTVIRDGAMSIELIMNS